VSEFDNSQWTVDQTLRWLTEGGPDRSPRFATREAALADVHNQLSDGTLDISGLPCRWEKGNIAERGGRQQIGLQVIDLEFIAVPNSADYYLAPQGLKPFEANYYDTEYDDGTGAVHPPIFSSWCDLRLRRGEILATWPASSASKVQAEPLYSRFYKKPEPGESSRARKVRIRDIAASIVRAHPDARQRDAANMLADLEGRSADAYIKMFDGWNNIKRRPRGA
jgi:hypothetical protein